MRTHTETIAHLPTVETVSQRVRRLQTEARSLAKDHIRQLLAAMGTVEQMAAEIADGGDAYTAGIRDLARRMAEDTEARTATIEALLARVS